MLRGYQKLSPLLFVQVDFNVAKLLPSTGIDEMTSSDLAVVAEALQVLLESPLGSLKWKQLVGIEIHRNVYICISKIPTAIMSKVMGTGEGRESERGKSGRVGGREGERGMLIPFRTDFTDFTVLVHMYV